MKKFGLIFHNLMLALGILLSILTISMARADTAVVRNDGGGNVTEYIKMRNILKKADSVRIEGKCFSACTIFTTLENACVTRTAQLGFHGVSPAVPIFQHFRDMRLGHFYRGEVKRLYESEWRHLRGPKLHVVSGVKLKQLDPEIRLCP